MKAVVLKDYDGTTQSLAAVHFSVPRLRSGQALIKLAATSIGPADLMFLKGQYGITKPLPVVPGFEGSGTVIASGGWMGRWLVGKRVACLAPEDGYGTWAEYMVTSTDLCIPLSKHLSFEQGAYLTINPMTAFALVGIARTGGHLAFAQTAAASTLGLMIARLAKRFQLTGIHIVRRPEQAQKLKSLGCEHVFDSNDASFQMRLAEACNKFKASIAFDAVGGELTRRLALAMPPESRIVVFGALADEPLRIDSKDFFFRDKKLEGFWLSRWIKKKGFLQKLLLAYQVQKLLSNDLQTRVQARFPLEDILSAIDLYEKQRTEGKVLLVPHRERVRNPDMEMRLTREGTDR
jgi:NADPH:quinone reductase-like Zn-dependent oxidoreductase